MTISTKQTFDGFLAKPKSACQYFFVWDFTSIRAKPLEPAIPKITDHGIFLYRDFFHFLPGPYKEFPQPIPEIPAQDEQAGHEGNFAGHQGPGQKIDLGFAV
jgi:hypothetical protein